MDSISPQRRGILIKVAIRQLWFTHTQLCSRVACVSFPPQRGDLRFRFPDNMYTYNFDDNSSLVMINQSQNNRLPTRKLDYKWEWGCVRSRRTMNQKVSAMHSHMP